MDKKWIEEVLQEFDEKFNMTHAKTEFGYGDTKNSVTYESKNVTFKAFLASKLKEAGKEAIKKYDALLFDKDSCYKAVGCWKTKRDFALKSFGIGEGK
jgi:hypothetical protein